MTLLFKTAIMLPMKKWLHIPCVITLCVGMLSACTKGKPNLSADVNIAVLKGPSSIGMIKLMDETDSGDAAAKTFSFEIFASADEIVPKIVQGKIDIAAVPPNLSSVLYNNTQGKVQVIAIGTLGMMYIVENGNSIASIEDLRGKKLSAGFRGKSPEYDLHYILNANGIETEKDLTIEWKSEHTESVAALAANTISIAVLPQPFATTALMLHENINIALDLNREWEKIQEKSGRASALVTGVLVARTEFIAQNPGTVAEFLDRYAASVEFAHTNRGETAALVEHYGIFPAAVAEKAIPYCNITFIEGQEMKDKLSDYLQILFEQNPQSVGGALPNDAFYFIR